MSDRAPRSVRRRLPPEQRRAMIVAAATRVISEAGYNSFTLSRVAAECQITRTGVEYYFGSREQLLVAVLRHRDEVDRDILSRTGDAPTEDELWATLDRLVERNAADREVVRLYAVLSAEALAASHPAHAYFAERETSIRAAFALAGRSWHPAPDRFGIEVLALMDGLQLRWLQDPGLDLVELWTTMRRTLREGLRPR